MRQITSLLFVFLVFSLCLTPAFSQTPRPYRLQGVDIKQRVIWGAECREPEGKGLAFGGQDQDADDGRPHTRILVDGKWQAVGEKLQSNISFQVNHSRIQTLLEWTKLGRSRERYLYFQGNSDDKQHRPLYLETMLLLEQRKEYLKSLPFKSDSGKTDDYTGSQIDFARGHFTAARNLLAQPGLTTKADQIRALHDAQIHLELAAEAFGVEPPPRAMNCGARHRENDTSPASQTLVYDKKTGCYVLFGGDHLDYLTCDTWVFDPTKTRWFQHHPKGAPPPRANHRLEAKGDGTITMTGGYTYTSNTEYIGGQYRDLNDGTWRYDIEKQVWTGGKLVPADSRVYRTGPFHPDYYLQGDAPSAERFAEKLKALPANEWVATNPPYRPRLNRDWGCARMDPDRDIMLRWSGGHSAHGGTDVPHFYFATNRWELPFPVEFPLGQLYSNTSYPNGFNFNRRPWVTGHTYQNWAYDPPSRKMIKAGRPRHFYVYDPELADWTGRGEKPEGMKYNSCFYTLTCVATPHGVVCWGKNAKVHRYDAKSRGWQEMKLSGEKLPGAYVDNSTIGYDSKRDRVLMINAEGYQKPYSGQIFALDMKTQSVTALSPAGMKLAQRFATVDRCCYDLQNDLLLMATYLKDAGDHTPTPAYDCAQNRWVTLDLKYPTGKRGKRVTRAFPHSRSCGIMYDPKRKLIWGTDTNSQVFVLRLEAKSVMKPLR